MKPGFDIVTEAPGWVQGLDLASEADLDALVDKVVDALPAAVAQGLDPPLEDGAGFALLLADDDRLAALNSEFRDKSGPTNVLSFPGDSPDHLGDIAIALQSLMREAAERDILPQAHFAHLLLHGILHLYGYDHETDDEAEDMESMETVVLAGLGIADPYAEPGAGEIPSRPSTGKEA
ncbi:MAG: rRNA maturation RNase YbeY [Rhodospirillaceae bacterium]